MNPSRSRGRSRHTSATPASSAVARPAPSLSISTVPSRNALTEDLGQPLLLVIGAGHFGTYPVSIDGELVFGRDPACAVALTHEKISRRHARVRAVPEPTPDGPAILVEDLESTNGVLIAGQRLVVGACAPLRRGESFQLGPFSVLVLKASAPQGQAEVGTRTAIVVGDPTLRGLPPTVARLAQSAISVIMLGETGTGKEVLARSLHEASGRAGPFVGINSAALSEPLLESELFGHERGSFTGAAHAKPGLLEMARNGTVFLDEIGDLPLVLQAKLLRAIETREVYRVGGLTPVALDVRFLAATHRDLGADVATGRFRSDLYYRLNGVTLHLLPLRNRRDAIPALARQFLEQAGAVDGRPPPHLSLEAISKLTRHDWPGNVRQLRNVIERAALLSSGEEIGARDIVIDDDSPGDRLVQLAEVARRHRGNVTLIARELGTSRSQVHRLAQRHGVDLELLRGTCAAPAR